MNILNELLNIDDNYIDILQSMGLMNDTSLRTTANYLEAHKESHRLRETTTSFKTFEGNYPSLLTVLIATMPQRKESFELLKKEVERQSKFVESDLSGKIVIQSDDTVGITIGEKRNKMLRRVLTPYLVWIDDDDWISGKFFQQIIETLKLNPGVDAACFNEYTVVGHNEPKVAVRSKDFPYADHGAFYTRTIDPKNVIKTEIAQTQKFPDLQRGEDVEWSKLITPLIKTEARVRGAWYYYEYSTGGSLTKSHG